MARQLLRFLGTRYGIALVLFALVLAVVGVARAVGDSSPDNPVGPPLPVASTGPSPSSELGDDGVTDAERSPTPSTMPGTPSPEVVALEFAQAWIDTAGKSSTQWLDGMEAHATDDLLAKLKGVDPTEVPADAVVGPATVVARDELLADVSIPVRPGRLVLRVVAANGRWLVDGVDWERP